MFYAGGAEGGFTFWTASYIQIHFNALPRAGGIGTACFALGMMVGRFAASKLATRFGLKRIIVFSVLLSLMVCSVFFLLNSLWILYLFMGLIGLSLACFWPSLQSYAVDVIPKDPTLIMIFLSCFGIPGFSSATLLMGIIGDHSGLKAGFIIAPLYLSVFLVLIIIERFVPVRK